MVNKRVTLLSNLLFIVISSLVSAQGIGHGGGTVPIITIDLTEEGVSYNITPSRLKFEFNGAPYAVQLREVEQEYAKFLVMILNASDPDNILAYTIDDSFILVPGEIREVDINHDGNKDLFIQLRTIILPSNNIRGADFLIKKMTIPSTTVSEENANDLSNYPSFFTKDGNDLILAVGDKSSSINVVAQTYILSSLSGINKKNKLASEVTDLNQNIISIGNPCVNEISARIMNNPEPCDKDFERGKAYIRLYKNDGFYHMVVAGYTDLGTKKAAEILADYQSYKFEEDEYVFEFSGDNGDRLTEEKKEAPKPQPIEKEQKEVEADTETEKDIQVETESGQKIAEEPEIEEKIEPKTEEKQMEKSDNIISKFISWFLSIFKK